MAQLLGRRLVAAGAMFCLRLWLPADATPLHQINAATEVHGVVA